MTGAQPSRSQAREAAVQSDNSLELEFQIRPKLAHFPLPTSIDIPDHSSACGAGVSVKPGVKRSRTPGTWIVWTSVSPRSGRQTLNIRNPTNSDMLSPTPWAPGFGDACILGLTPQALR